MNKYIVLLFLTLSGCSKSDYTVETIPVGCYKDANEHEIIKFLRSDQILGVNVIFKSNIFPTTYITQDNIKSSENIEVINTFIQSVNNDKYVKDENCAAYNNLKVQFHDIKLNYLEEKIKQLQRALIK